MKMKEKQSNKKKQFVVIVVDYLIQFLKQK
jgi:hypothetical protein